MLSHVADQETDLRQIDIALPGELPGHVSEVFKRHGVLVPAIVDALRDSNGPASSTMQCRRVLFRRHDPARDNLRHFRAPRAAVPRSRDRLSVIGRLLFPRFRQTVEWPPVKLHLSVCADASPWNRWNGRKHASV